MSRERHEALRKDIEDFKLLLGKYQALRIEQEVLIKDLVRQGKLLKNNSDLVSEFRKKNEDLMKEIDALNAKLEKQMDQLGDLQEDYKTLSQNYYKEKAKVNRMTKAQTELNVWRGLTVFFFIMMLIAGSQN